ncbi:hypothetical protein V1264_020614 [Littorina saxatilis]|uniref:Uncharacterized protein n=2 Tax=Littorina saxatilis TaxID=31220 RepID=A0AAN9BAE0_9CAEN
MLVFLVIFLFLGLVSAEPKDNQVYIISRLCDTTVSIDSSRESDRWRRLLFAKHETCQGFYTCQVTFRANQTEVCIDFARLRLYGNKTTMTFTQDDNFLQILTSRWYPKTEMYMKSKVCAAPGSDLVLKIQADCSKSLHRAIIGWFYAYTQSSSKGELYFVDGACKHKHRLAEGAPVTVRSQLWADMGSEFPDQYSSLNLSLPYDLNNHAICISMISTSDFLIPAGVQVTVRKVYFNRDKTLQLYLSLKAEDWIHASDLRCYGLSTQELLIEVIRDTRVPHLSPLTDGKTLFLLKAEIGLEHNTTTKNNIVSDGDEENPDTESMDGSPGGFTSYTSVILKSILGCVAVCSLICCVFFRMNRSKRTASEARDAEDRVNQPQPGMGERADSYVSVNSLNFPMVRPEAHPMLPVLTPTAPSWEQQGFNDGGTLSRGGASDLPPSYEDVSGGVGAGSNVNPAPPAYSDLFPVRKT